MLNVLIFSKNRANQLNTLIESLYKNWEFDNCIIEILYLSTDKKFYQGYEKLIEKYSKENIHFHQQINFKEQTIDLCHNEACKFVMLLTDDSVFYRKVPFGVLDIDSIMTEDVFSLSLRLGENTTIQNYLTGETQKTLQEIGSKRFFNDKLVKWKFRLHKLYSNYNYIGSLDGQIYRSKELKENIIGKNFCIPRGLEYQLVIDKNLYNTIPPNFVSPVESCVFVNTINAVQEDSTIPSGIYHNYSALLLNDMLLSGKKISCQSFEDLVLFSSHEEIPLKFEKW